MQTPAPRLPAQIIQNPAEFARYKTQNARLQARIDELQALSGSSAAAGKPRVRNRPSASTAAGHSIVASGGGILAGTSLSTFQSLPAFEIEDADDFSDSDKVLFAQAAGTDSTTISMTDEFKNLASYGTFSTYNARIEWSFNSSNLYFLSRCGSQPQSFEGSGSYFSFGAYDDANGLVVTRVDFIPLTRNADNNVETFRVDFYKKLLDATAMFGEGEDIPAGVYSTTTEKLALSLLFTEKILFNAYIQSDVRFLQSDDEIALQAYLASKNVRTGAMYSSFNNEMPYPVGSVANVQERGLTKLLYYGENHIPAGWVEDNQQNHTTFSLESTLKGLVWHSRLPLSIFSPATASSSDAPAPDPPPDTPPVTPPFRPSGGESATIPRWMLVMTVLSFILAFASLALWIFTSNLWQQKRWPTGVRSWQQFKAHDVSQDIQIILDSKSRLNE